MNLDIQVNIQAAEILARRGLGSSKAAQHHLASEVERLSQPYVPMQQGLLQNSAQVNDDSITYTGPHSHYQYTGEAMAGRAPKHYTGKPLTYHGAPMRGKEWDKRMMADHSGEVEESLKNFIARRGR